MRGALVAVAVGAATGLDSAAWDPTSTCSSLVDTAGLNEVCAAPSDACLAAFRTRQRKSCTSVCSEAAGLECQAAFDDLNDDGMCPPGAAVDCGQALYSKVCQCGRAGAPTAVVVPLDLARETTDCALVSREVLTAKNATSGAHEVQRLVFRLPADARTDWDAPAHVKVRAPDAPGQPNRVRAFSARLSADRETFASRSGVPPSLRLSALRRIRARPGRLTVKIYPGGPPATRGTSAHLGALALGATLDVPQYRSMHWAVALAAVERLCVVAFGVGVAEALEPVEMALDRAGQGCDIGQLQRLLSRSFSARFG